MSKGFRVIVEDLDSGQVTARTVHPGDYILIPFAPCYLHSEQVWLKPRGGTVNLTLRGFAPQDKPSPEVDGPPVYQCTTECRDEHCLTPSACEDNGTCPPQVLPNWPEAWLNRPRAREVRTWRVGLALSWRGVASTASAAWTLSYADNQLFGRDLCHAAATLLGENPDDAPWNSAASARDPVQFRADGEVLQTE